MIYKKMEILKQSEIISPAVYEYTLNVIEALNENSFDITTDKAQVFLTHLAMAAGRQTKGESMEKMEEFILTDLTSQPQFTEAKDISDTILLTSPISFVDAEKDYVYLHMCNLLAEKQGA